MSVLSRIVGKRSTLSEPSEDLIAALGGQPTFAGKTVTVANSLQLIPVYRAVNFISAAIGSMPLEVFRHTADGQREPVSHTSRVWSLLHDKPNVHMAADEMWQLVLSHLLTWGNAFVWKERGADGRIANLWPIDPRRVQVGRDVNGKPVFLVQTFQSTPFGQDYITAGPSVVADDTDILHIRGLGFDGLVGFSPIQLARQRLGSMMAQQEFGGRFWANDATPGITLIHPKSLTPEALDRLKAKWDQHHRGTGKARATAVLGENIKVEQMSVSLADSQFIESAKYDRGDVALLFGLPAYSLNADVGGGMTYTNTEWQSLDLLKWSFRQWMVRVECALTWDEDLMPQNWYAKYNADETLRGSMTERYAAYGIAPHLLIDEARAMEDMPPLPEGKGQVLTKTIGPPRGTTIPVQDQPLQDQPTPGEGEPVGDVPAGPTPDGGTKA